jgi:hypothetical protein
MLTVLTVFSVLVLTLIIARKDARQSEEDRATKPQWEFPRLCRGGSKSLTYPAVHTAAPSTKLRIVSHQAHEEGVR